MKNLNPEMIEKAKAAKSAEELLEIAKENSIEMTIEDATKIFSKLNSPESELSDDELAKMKHSAEVLKGVIAQIEI